MKEDNFERMEIKKTEQLVAIKVYKKADPRIKVGLSLDSR